MKDNHENHRVVFNTCPNHDTALKIANTLIEQGLAACVNIVPGLESIYKWKGKIEHGTECLLIIKTNIDRYTELEQAIVKHHPYELPEIIAVPLSEGLPAYLGWMDESLKQ